jgi:hypothetical protein
MLNMPSLFERVLFEAEGDDISNDGNINNEGPPDIGVDEVDTQPDDTPLDEPPPELEDFPDIGDGTGAEDNIEDESENLDINEKISAVMNENLYKKFLSLISVITDHISLIKDNNDIIYSLSPNALGIIDSLKKLRDNINLYLSYNFINNNYSRNLLFFNKCFNLLNLLDKNFEKNIKQ